MSFSVTVPYPQQQSSENYEQRGTILQRATGSKNALVMKCMYLCAVQSSMIYAFLHFVLQKSRIFFFTVSRVDQNPNKTVKCVWEPGNVFVYTALHIYVFYRKILFFNAELCTAWCGALIGCCAAAVVVRSTTRSSALTRDWVLSSRRCRPSLCSNAAARGFVDF